MTERLAAAPIIQICAGARQAIDLCSTRISADIAFPL
jgi:hypothetical protein